MAFPLTHEIETRKKVCYTCVAYMNCNLKVAKPMLCCCLSVKLNTDSNSLIRGIYYNTGVLVSKNTFCVEFISWERKGNLNYVVTCYVCFQNWEIQAYTNDPLNCFTRDGNLYLKPVRI